MSRKASSVRASLAVFGLAVVAVSLYRLSLPSPPSNLENSRANKSLLSVYENYAQAPLFDHWLEYAHAYEQHLPRQGKAVNILEIGVQSGGSTRVWKEYYGENLRYVGVDVNPNCSRSASPKENIFVEIGSQLDEAFVEKICAKYGPFDVVIDDGGHTFDMINRTLHFVFPRDSCMRSDSVYVVEDLHTMVMCDVQALVPGATYCDSPEQFGNLVAELYFSMLNFWMPFSLPARRRNSTLMDRHPVWGNRVSAIHLYDSLMFLVRGKRKPLTRITRGTDSIPYS